VPGRLRREHKEGQSGKHLGTGTPEGFSTEDIHEAWVIVVPGIEFGVAPCEASGPCLVRSTGADEGLTKVVEGNAMNISAAWK
jgi:adenosine/AMP kinase